MSEACDVFDILCESSFLSRSDIYKIPKVPGIYVLRNTETGMLYVGRSVDVRKRLYSHFSREYRRNSGKKLANAKDKYGLDAFSFSVLETCDRGSVRERENYYLNLLRPFDDVGYNIRKEASDEVSFVMPDNQKEKLSISLKEYHKSNDNAFKGKMHSEQSRERIRRGLRNSDGSLKSDKSRTEEWREARSKQSKELGIGERLQSWVEENGHPREIPVVMIDKETNQELMCFTSIINASKYLEKPRATALYNHLNGRSNTAYGFKWKKIAK